MTNPYESSAVKSATNKPNLRGPELYPPLRRWLTIPVGIILGGISAGVIASVFAIIFVVILGRLFGFVMIDSLLVFILPLLSLPGGMLGGFIVGGLRKWPKAYWLVMLAASVPACVFFFMNAWDHELAHDSRAQLCTTAVISICMLAASAISSNLVARLLAAIEKYTIARRTTTN